MTSHEPVVSVPREGDPPATCDYCGRPFESEHAHALHLGDRHAEECTAEERRASEQASDDERERLFYLQVKALLLLALLWMTTLLGYMLAGGLRWNA
ncbi:MAG: DNA-binding protein [Haloplanus sp.]